MHHHPVKEDPILKKTISIDDLIEAAVKTLWELPDYDSAQMSKEEKGMVELIRATMGGDSFEDAYGYLSDCREQLEADEQDVIEKAEIRLNEAKEALTIARQKAEH